MALAQIADVGDTLGRPITDTAEVMQVAVWLRRVEARIRTRVPDLVALAAADPDYRQTVVDIEADIVARRVKNPDGKQNERIDDYSYGLAPEATAVDLWPTDDEWALLVPALGPVGGMYVIDLGTPWPGP